MSISTEIERLQNLRNSLRTKLVSFGVVTSTAALGDCVSAVEGINNNGAVSKKLDATTSSYTIPAGYHNGNGKVNIELEQKNITANGKYTPSTGKVFSEINVNVENAASLQQKTVTPTKSEQLVEPDVGYDGLSKVTVEAIPNNYSDVSSVTATAENVLANKVFVDKLGKTTAGTMVNNGAVETSIDGINLMSYTIPAGYHNGTGKVTLNSDIETALAAI